MNKFVLIFMFCILGSIQVWSQDIALLSVAGTNRISKQYTANPQLRQEKDAAEKIWVELTPKFKEYGSTDQTFRQAIKQLEIGNVDQALTLLDEQKNDSKGLISVLKARLNIVNLNFYEAEKNYLNAINSSNRNFDILIEFGMFYYYQDMKALAKAIFQDALISSKGTTNIALASQYIGDCALFLGSYKQATANYTSAYTIYKKQKTNVNKQIQLALQLANAHYKIHQKDSATYYFKETQQLLNKKNTTEKSIVWNMCQLRFSSDYGIFLLKEHQFALAEKQLQETVRLSKSFSYHSLEAETWFNIGVARNYQNQTTASINAFQTSLTIFDKLVAQDSLQYLPRQADIYNNLGILFNEQGDNNKALEAYQSASEIFAKLLPEGIEFQLGLAYLKNNIASIYKENKEFQNAFSFYDAALTDFNELALHDFDAFQPDIAMIFNNQGLIFEENNQYDYALEKYQKALQIREYISKKDSLKYRHHIADNLIDIANLSRKQEQYGVSLTSYLGALALYKNLSIEDRTYCNQVLITQNSLAFLYLSMDRNTEAKNAYKQTLAEAIKCSNSTEAITDAYIQLSLCYTEENKNDSALYFNTLALELLQKDTCKVHLNFTSALQQQAVILSKINDPNTANIYFEKSYNLAKKNAVEHIESRDILFNLCQVMSSFYIRNNQNKSALEVTLTQKDAVSFLYSKQPEKYSTKMVETLNNLALLFALSNQPDSAIIYDKQLLAQYVLLEASSPGKYQVDILGILVATANNYLVKNDKISAIDYYTQAMNFLDKKTWAIDKKQKKVELLESISYCLVGMESLNKIEDALILHNQNPKGTTLQEARLYLAFGETSKQILTQKHDKAIKEKGESYTSKAIQLLEAESQSSSLQNLMNRAIQLRGFFSTYSGE